MDLMDFTMDADDPAITPPSLNEILSPSQHIPPEIVVKIIHSLLPTKIDYGSLIQERLNVLLKVTSICRYWRYAALDHATLWSTVPMDRRSLGEVFLRRSRSLPLLITYEVSTRRCCPAHQAMVSLLPHMQRVRKVQFRASAPVLDQIFSILNLYTSGAQLEEIRIQVHGSPNNGKSRVALDLLLENAPTLKVLQLDVLKCRFPVHKLQEFSSLTHLELLSTHDFREVSPLFTSLQTLSSIKVCVTASEKRGDNSRIVPQANLRYIHLRINDRTPNLVLNALEVPAGVHFECEMSEYINAVEMNHLLPLASQAFQNTSHIEELRIFSSSHHPISLTSYSGLGPTGSFSVRGYFEVGYRPPIEDFSHLRKISVDGLIDLSSLEMAVASAPRLLSVSLVGCTIVKFPMTNYTFGSVPSPADAHSFVKAISEERRVGGARGPDRVLVSGTLEGELLEAFRSLSGDRDQVGNHNKLVL